MIDLDKINFRAFSKESYFNYSFGSAKRMLYKHSLPNGIMLLHWLRFLVLASFFLLVVISKSDYLYGQEKEKSYQRDNYFLSEEEKRLAIVVHVWGEINRPGEYLVPDGTNVLELISKAGGPTQYSNLSNVILTRGNVDYMHLSTFSRDSVAILPPIATMPISSGAKRVLKLNLSKYLDNEKYENLIILQPGDVIRVKRNNWFKWETAIRFVSQIAIIVQAWYWYTRINK